MRTRSRNTAILFVLAAFALGTGVLAAPALAGDGSSAARVCPLAGVAKKVYCCPIYAVRGAAHPALRCPAPPCCPRRAGERIACPMLRASGRAIACPPPCLRLRAGAVVKCPPPPEPHAYVTIASRRARVSRRHVTRIRLRCHRGRGRCRGALRLRAPFVADDIRTTGGRVRIGSARYAIAVGTSARVAVHLNRIGRFLLAHTHPHRLRARATAGHARRTVVLLAARRRH